MDLNVVNRVMAIAERGAFFKGDGFVNQRRCGLPFMKHLARALGGRSIQAYQRMAGNGVGGDHGKH